MSLATTACEAAERGGSTPDADLALTKQARDTRDSDRNRPSVGMVHLALGAHPVRT